MLVIVFRDKYFFKALEIEPVLSVHELIGFKRASMNYAEISTYPLYGSESCDFDRRSPTENY
jgi:hypothetical protein